VRSSNFTTYIDELTDNTFIMLVYSDPLIEPAAIAYNVNYAKNELEKSNMTDLEKLVLLKELSI
jgi:Ras-related GTP-binding protein A/B